MEDCLFSLNIPLQILPSTSSGSGRLRVSSLSPSQEFCMADSEQQDPPLPSPSYCRHTLYQSITDTVNTSVSQYYLVIPLYYDAYSNNIYEIFLLFARLVTYLSCYHPRSHSKSTPDIISSDGCVPVLRRGEECQHLTFKIRKQAETR